MQQSTQLLLEIARCPVLMGWLSQSDPGHSCHKVLASQGTRVQSRRQVPEPWNGRIETARVLFIGSNPSFKVKEQFPVLTSSDDEICRFFTARLDDDAKWGAYKCSVRNRAAELLQVEPKALKLGDDY